VVRPKRALNGGMARAGGITSFEYRLETFGGRASAGAVRERDLLGRRALMARIGYLLCLGEEIFNYVEK
jgi:hypothetical protein